MKLLIKTERKGVNIQEFLSKRSIKQNTLIDKPKEKTVERKSASVLIASNKENKKKDIEKVPNKHSENSEKLEVNLFKFIDASRIVEKDKLLSFVKWFGIPKEVRKLKTQSEFATAFGLNIDTLTSWKKIVGFYDEVEIYHLNEMKRFMADVGMAIVKSAKKGNPKSAELYLKYYMDWSEKIRVKDETPERIITDEEKVQIDHALKNIGLATIIKNNERVSSND